MRSSLPRYLLNAVRRHTPSRGSIASLGLVGVPSNVFCLFVWRLCIALSPLVSALLRRANVGSPGKPNLRFVVDHSKSNILPDRLWYNSLYNRGPASYAHGLCNQYGGGTSPTSVHILLDPETKRLLIFRWRFVQPDQDGRHYRLESRRIRTTHAQLLCIQLAIGRHPSLRRRILTLPP